MANNSRLRTGDQLRLELLTAATDLLSQRLSINLPSLREIARVCGVSATAVYRYFPSQQELLHATASQSLVSLREALNLPMPGEERYRSISDLYVVSTAYAAWGVANPGAYQLLFEARERLERFESIDSGVESLQSGLESMLAAGAVNSVEQRQRAELLWIALHGLVLTRIRKTRQDWSRSLSEDAKALVDAFAA